ncbi:MAG: DUF1127 domain-containing protein [Pseudomonadota bacterium]
MNTMTTARAPFGAISTFKITRVIADLIADFNGWQERRETYRELSRLSPEMLEDIGLTRADLEDNFIIR